MLGVIAAATVGQRWDLYIYTDDDGQTYASTRIPSECSGASNIRYLSLSGKDRPAELSVPYRIDDMDAWVRDYEEIGYSFDEQR